MPSYCKTNLKKYSPLFIALLSALVFFGVTFIMIRIYYYGEVPSMQEYVFPAIMGTLFGGGIGLWLIQNNQYKREIEKIISELKINNDKLMSSNEELKATQRELHQSQKMEVIGTMAGAVAHDLNNVLSASINYPEMLLMKIPEDSPLKETIKDIRKSGLKAAAMVQDFLTLARRGVPIENVINLNNIVHEFISSPEFEGIKKYHPGVEIEINLENDLLNIQGSPFHIMKTIANLVSNAAEAMPNGGMITLETKNQKIEETIRGYEEIKPGEYIVLIVSDAGVGISSDDINKIFEPFYTKKVMGRSGTGLGMAVVWGTVRDHKGFMDIKSIEGEGTRFALYFPITKKELDRKDTAKPIEDYKGNGELILLVDDMEEQRKIAYDILSTLDYSVITVSSGEEAVQFFKSRHPELVILNMIMEPGIDGLETYKRILKYNPIQKALIISGYTETDKVKRALELGAGQFIKKPYTLEQLGTAVKEELMK